MTTMVDWDEVKSLLDALCSASSRLEKPTPASASRNGGPTTIKIDPIRVSAA